MSRKAAMHADVRNLIALSRDQSPQPDGCVQIVSAGGSEAGDAALSQLLAMGYQPVKTETVLAVSMPALSEDSARALGNVVSLMASRLADRQAEHDSSYFERAVELAVEETPISPSLKKQVEMQVRALNRLMASGDWMSAREIEEAAGRKSTNPSAHTSKWKKQGRIFSILHKQKEYYPGYGLDPAKGCMPKPELAEVLKVFGSEATGLQLAFWFDSANSYLGGQKPKEVLSSRLPDVLLAAQREVQGAEHG